MRCSRAPSTQPTLTIRELGGQVGGRMGWVFANPEYTVGERVLLFLDQRPDGTLRVMHFYLGKFSIITDPANGDLVAVRPLPEEVTIIRRRERRPRASRWVRSAAGSTNSGSTSGTRPARPGRSRRGRASACSSPRRGSRPDGVSEHHEEFRFLRDPNPPTAQDPNLVQPRFVQPDTNTPIVMRFNVNGEPLAPAGSDSGREQVRAAFRAWGRVPTTSFRYVEGAATDLGGLHLGRHQRRLVPRPPRRDLAALGVQRCPGHRRHVLSARPYDDGQRAPVQSGGRGRPRLRRWLGRLHVPARRRLLPELLEPGRGGHARARPHAGARPLGGLHGRSGDWTRRRHDGSLRPLRRPQRQSPRRRQGRRHVHLSGSHADHPEDRRRKRDHLERDGRHRLRRGLRGRLRARHQRDAHGHAGCRLDLPGLRPERPGAVRRS